MEANTTKYKIIDPKGRLTIPHNICNKYGIKPGTHIILSEEKDCIKLIPMTPEIMERNIGFLGKDNHLLKALLNEKEAERKL